MNQDTENRLQRCAAILSGDDWLSVGEGHDSAENTVNKLLMQIYETADADYVNGWIRELGVCYQATVISDRLHLIESIQHLEFYENDGIEVSEDELNALFESGQAVEISQADVKRAMGRLH